MRTISEDRVGLFTKSAAMPGDLHIM